MRLERSLGPPAAAESDQVQKGAVPPARRRGLPAERRRDASRIASAGTDRPGLPFVKKASSDFAATRSGNPASRIMDQALQLLKDHLPGLPPPETVLSNLVRLTRALAGPGSSGKAMPPAVQRLSKLLEQLLARPVRAQEVHNLVRAGGLQYESRLAHLVRSPNPAASLPEIEDLKGILLELQAAMTKDPPGSLAELGRSAEQYLRHIEVQQAHNLINWVSQGAITLQVPVAMGDELVLAHLQVQPDRSGREPSGSAGATRILFLLDLSSLGRTRIDVLLRSNVVSADFSLQEQAVEFVQEKLPELKTSLEELGFQKVSLNVRTRSGLPEAEAIGNSLSAPPLGVSDAEHLINIEV